MMPSSASAAMSLMLPESTNSFMMASPKTGAGLSQRLDRVDELAHALDLDRDTIARRAAARCRPASL